MALVYLFFAKFGSSEAHPCGIVHLHWQCTAAAHRTLRKGTCMRWKSSGLSTNTLAYPRTVVSQLMLRYLLAQGNDLSFIPGTLPAQCVCTIHNVSPALFDDACIPGLHLALQL